MTNKMRGTMHILTADGLSSLRGIVAAPPLEELQRLVGGYLELVPSFGTVRANGAIERCVAFCNEDGKRQGLPFNYRATRLWEEAVRRNGVMSIAPDYLVGTIVIIAGDRELMDSMRDDGE